MNTFKFDGSTDVRYSIRVYKTMPHQHGIFKESHYILY